MALCNGEECSTSTLEVRRLEAGIEIASLKCDPDSPPSSTHSSFRIQAKEILFSVQFLVSAASCRFPVTDITAATPRS